ncbi:hypothetical protein HC766_03285 [Candidatus Gracilibacteria bacterium]|nr:hypothetical protein [Candidatus Gracilibacteria bacterium]
MIGTFIIILMFVIVPIQVSSQDSTNITIGAGLDSRSEKVNQLRSRRSELNSEMTKLDEEKQLLQNQLLELEKERLTLDEEIKLDQKNGLSLTSLTQQMLL